MKNTRIKVLNSVGQVLGTLLVPDDGARTVELEVAPESMVQLVSGDEQFVKAEYLTFHIGLAMFDLAKTAFHAANVGDTPIETLRRIKGFEEGETCEKV